MILSSLWDSFSCTCTDYTQSNIWGESRGDLQVPFSLLVPLPDLSMALFSLSLSVSLFLTLSVPLSLPSLIFSPLNSGACLPKLLLCHFIVESIGFCLGSLPCVVPCKHFKALNCGGYRVHLICFPYISDIYLTSDMCGEKTTGILFIW